MEASNPTKTYEWNILCYSFTNNELEIGSFKDLAKLTSLAHNHQSVIVHMLICTETMVRHANKGGIHEAISVNQICK